MEGHRLTPWSTVLLKKLTITETIKNYPHFMEPEDESPCSKEPATGPYPELNEYNLPTPTQFLQNTI
jgi:hypothetical protein